MGNIESFLCENFEIMCDNDLEKHHSRGRRPNRPPKQHQGGGTRRLKRVNRPTRRRR